MHDNHIICNYVIIRHNIDDIILLCLDDMRIFVGPGAVAFVTVLEHSDIWLLGLSWEMGHMFKMKTVRISTAENRNNLTRLRFKLSRRVSLCIIIQVFIYA